mmetsp:Transcript_16054/g.24191  ORF Transcript_16054/g.24191 Transcript_16054/m.24191 type:complete len:238 (+) Transcript_16054:63-776(+)
MSAKLDMALDDIPKEKKGQGNRGGRKQQRGGGPVRNRRRFNNNQAPYPQRNRPVEKKQKKIMLAKNKRVFVSGLNANMNSNEVEAIFEEIGVKDKITSIACHHDENGGFLGTALLLFKTGVDAYNLVKDYDRALINGEIMYLDFVVPAEKMKESNKSAEVDIQPPKRSNNDFYYEEEDYGYQQQNYRRPRGGGNRRGRGRGARSKKPNNAGGRKKKEPVTKEDLDKEMDNYRFSHEK